MSIWVILLIIGLGILVLLFLPFFLDLLIILLPLAILLFIIGLLLLPIWFIIHSDKKEERTTYIYE